jgi:hypothetical protein
MSSVLSELLLDPSDNPHILSLSYNYINILSRILQFSQHTPYALAALYPQEDSGYSFLLEVDLILPATL